MKGHRPYARLVLAIALGAGLVAVGAAPVSAHAELVASTPASGDVLDEAPTEVVLTFETEITEESTFTVEDSRGMVVGRGQLDLDIVERNVLWGSMDAGETGEYVVRWSVTDALDGDITTGEFSFEVRGGAPTASLRPDTALAGGPATRALGTAGVLLVCTAVCTSLWTWSRRRAEA